MTASAHVRPARRLSAVLPVACLLALGAAGGEPRAQAAPALPADLVALEQKMAALRFNTERLTLQLEMQTGVKLFGPASPPLVLLAVGAGEISDSPPEASFTLSDFGQTREVREIGGELYTFEPDAAKTDGGRSWVRSRAKTPVSALAVGPSGLEGELLPASGSFAPLAVLLSSATTVQETGPAIVDDQPTTEFTATIDPTKLAGWGKLLNGKSSLTRELPGTHEPPTSRLEVFLAPTGLPVRIRFMLKAARNVLTLTSDTLALEVPVEVQAPPARAVIDETRLEVLRKRERERERARLERELHKLCKRLPERRRRRCSTHLPLPPPREK